MNKLNADAERLARITDLLFEAGMLRKTPRQGWAFLGSGKEDVAQHSFRVALMCFVLAEMAGADPYRCAVMGLLHDLHEARTSDLNYVHQRYAELRQRDAQKDACEGTGLEDTIMGLYDEFEERTSLEAQLAKDADQLDFIFNLKVELDLGNAFAREWLDSALLRLRTEQAKQLAKECMHTDHARWWYGRVDRRWWVDRVRDAELSPANGATSAQDAAHWRDMTPQNAAQESADSGRIAATKPKLQL